MIDVAAVRADTPGCAQVVHLNNAGAALPSRAVVQTVVAHLEREAAIGGYEAATEAGERTEAVYDSVASLVGADRDEIAVVESATRAWTVWFSALRFAPGDRLLTHRVEYASNFLPMLQAAARDGAEIHVVPSAPTGEIDVDALAGMLDERVRLVALTHVPSQSGLVNPAAAVGAVTRAAGVPFVLDACQSAGQLPLSVADVGCDVLVATGRKYLRGPRGTGFLYVRRSYLDTLVPYGVDLRGAEWSAPSEYRLRPDARRFEHWERSIACVLGLGVAVDQALALGVDDIRIRVQQLAAGLRDRLARYSGIVVRDEGRERCGIVTFTVEGEKPGDVVARLRTRGINTYAIDASTARLDLGARAIDAVVRASVHYYNTDDELDRVVQVLAERR